MRGEQSNPSAKHKHSEWKDFQVFWATLISQWASSSPQTQRADFFLSWFKFFMFVIWSFVPVITKKKCCEYQSKDHLHQQLPYSSVTGVKLTDSQWPQVLIWELIRGHGWTKRFDFCWKHMTAPSDKVMLGPIAHPGPTWRKASKRPSIATS